MSYNITMGHRAETLLGGRIPLGDPLRMPYSSDLFAVIQEPTVELRAIGVANLALDRTLHPQHYTPQQRADIIKESIRTAGQLSAAGQEEQRELLFPNLPDIPSPILIFPSPGDDIA